MRIDIYGRPYDKTCQEAVGLLKSARIRVKFHNTDKDYSRSKLIGVTKDLQQKGDYTFKTLYNAPIPIVISEDTQEVLCGFETNSNLYHNMLVFAGINDPDGFTRKHFEWKRKPYVKHETRQ